MVLVARRSMKKKTRREGVHVLERGTWERQTLLQGSHTKEVTMASWSANGRYLCSAGLDKQVFLWDLSSAESLDRYKCEAAVCEQGCGLGVCAAPDTCECSPGWGGADCTEPLCAAGCGAHGSCLTGECSCDVGYSGAQCQQCASGFFASTSSTHSRNADAQAFRVIFWMHRATLTLSVRSLRAASRQRLKARNSSR